MALHVTKAFEALYGAAPQTDDEGPTEIPAKVLKKFLKHVTLHEDEQLLLLVDETLLGSGKEGVAVTTHRLVSYDKSKLRLNLTFTGLEGVRQAKIDHADGLIVQRTGGRTLRLRITHASTAEIKLMAKVIKAALDDGSEAESEWQCPTCGPGIIIYVPAVRYAAGGEAQIMLTAKDLHICRKCGLSSLQIDAPELLRVESIPGAELRASG